jgi:hypothetical protein
MENFFGFCRDAIPANQFMSLAKLLWLFGFSENPVQTIYFLVHGPLAHVPVLKQDQQIPVGGGFHVNTVLNAAKTSQYPTIPLWLGHPQLLPFPVPE